MKDFSSLAKTNTDVRKPVKALPFSRNSANVQNVHIDPEALFQMYQDLTVDGELKIVSGAEWLKYGTNNVAAFLHTFNLWTAPTLELIDIIDDEIGDLSCIEICAGLGLIGKELGITTTDSHLHATDEFKKTFNVATNTNNEMVYPSYVEELEASAAVDKYKPDCVLGCYAVPLWTEEKATKYFLKTGKELSGSIRGVDYDYIYPRVKKLILVGHKSLYEQHTIWNKPHKAIINKYIITRKTFSGLSAVYVFNKLLVNKNYQL